MENGKLEKIGPENGTWLRYMKGALGPLRKLAQNLHGGKGVDAHWQLVTSRNAT